MIPSLFRRRPGHATVVAYLALFVALGGSSYAALKLPEGSVGNDQLRKNAVTSGKVKNRSLIAKDFAAGELPEGPRGLPGQAGAPGQPGDPGQPGSPAASMVNGYVPASLTSEFAGEGNGYPAAGTAEGSAYSISPNATVVLRNLVVRVSPPASGGTRTFYLGDAQDTSPPGPAISCQIPAGQNLCNTGSQTATVGPGRIMELFIENAFPLNPSNVDVAFAYRAITP
jgi:hypothetical protein